MRIAEIDLSDFNKAAKDIESICDLGKLAHYEIKQQAATGKYKFPVGIGEEYTIDSKKLITLIASKSIRAFMIHNGDVAVAYSLWSNGSGFYNVGYKPAAMFAIYVEKKYRQNNTFEKLVRFSAETLKREGCDTFIVANEGTALHAIARIMGLKPELTEYRI